MQEDTLKLRLGMPPRPFCPPFFLVGQVKSRCRAVDVTDTGPEPTWDCRGIMRMGTTGERRGERRLCYNWPIWFAEDFSGELSQGQMADLSSIGAAFTCYADDRCPYPGQHVTARFSIPQYGPDDSFDMVDIIRSGHVCRVEGVSNALRRIAIRFAEPLPFRPGEQASAVELCS